ncbi:DUF6851 domain-containing protein [Neolewinella antarctica]|uniref:DUF6851 domain-containing protein n=1 Tax=Neolewinella antarctica TaxID=442734 RepID=A0ABX0XBS6_9BACT|nr:T9SS type A sorting domain-containing protein [Neolewinella antarctica]NJC26421.1 hypothetical protein [Neolewinella antarctica]
MPAARQRPLLITFALLLFYLATAPIAIGAQTTEHSVARQWNEQLLEAIRNDFARPVVHARNLYHVSAATYDCWALVNKSGTPALLDNVQVPIDHWLVPDYPDPEAAAREAVSFAAYRLLIHRYQNSPGAVGTTGRLNVLLTELGYDGANVSLDYKSGDPAALGNYVASQIIRYGMTDGSNEAMDFANSEYADPVNPALDFNNVFSIFQLRDPVRWQSLQFPGVVIDQSGNPVGDGAPLPFLGAEWGRVTPFAMDAADRSMADADFQFGNSFVYHDPGPPPVFTRTDTAGLAEYRWNFETVLKWSGHLDPSDGVEWDISPGASGNLTAPYPTTLAEYRDFYLKEGGTAGSNGHALNPVTGEAYPPNIVPRGDYARVLAEFWADGPASETPPGHWFDIFNGVMDHPLFERKLAGTGPELSPLEYDVKAYLALGGALHDAAISAWSIKGAYDYIRPISAIRWMGKNGQSTNPNGDNPNIFGLELDPGYIEPLDAPGELQNLRTLAQTQAWGWIGPDSIIDPLTDVAGVGWINPAYWFPYQRPTFVTPNFAGYISGHSTYSSAAAYVLEKVTGSPFFPGGVGEFVAKKDEFLVFEKGPSVDVVLQWATYRDASDQTSLSRIWGGIHPPVDDIPGRRIGIVVGADAVEKSFDLFAGDLTSISDPERTQNVRVFPNPVAVGEDVIIEIPEDFGARTLVLSDLTGRAVRQVRTAGAFRRLPTQGLQPGVYFVRVAGGKILGKVVIL